MDKIYQDNGLPYGAEIVEIFQAIENEVASKR